MQALSRSFTAASSAVAAAGRRTERRQRGAHGATSVVCQGKVSNAARGVSTKSRRGVRVSAAEQKEFGFNLEDLAKPFISANDTLNEGRDAQIDGWGGGSQPRTERLLLIHLMVQETFLLKAFSNPPAPAPDRLRPNEPRRLGFRV